MDASLLLNKDSSYIHWIDLLVVSNELLKQMVLVFELVQKCSSSQLVIVTRMEEADFVIKLFSLAILNYTEKRVRQENFSWHNQEFTSCRLVELVSPLRVTVEHFIKLLLFNLVF